MNPLNRLHLRENWPLWVSGILCTLAVIFSVGTIFSPIRYPFGSTILYPLTVIYSASALWLEGIALIALLIVVAWIVYTTGGRGLTWIVPTALAASSVVCVAVPPIGILGILAALVTLMYHAFKQTRKQGAITLFVTLAAVLMFIPAVIALFISLEHRNSLAFEDHIYNLALVTDSDMDCHNEYYVVYQCDSLGLVCHPLKQFDGFSMCLGMIEDPEPSSVSLIADTAQNQVVLEMDGKRFPVTP